MKYSINDLTRSYYEIKNEVPTYRLGQYFIYKLIKDSSSQEMQQLWNEWDDYKAQIKIHEIVNRYEWDYHDLPLLEGK